MKLRGRIEYGVLVMSTEQVGPSMSRSEDGYGVGRWELDPLL